MCDLLICWVIGKKPNNFKSLPSQWMNVKSITNLKRLLRLGIHKIGKKSSIDTYANEAQLLPYDFICVSCAIFIGIRIKKTWLLTSRSTALTAFIFTELVFFGIEHIKKAVFKIRVQHLGRISIDFDFPWKSPRK